GGRPSGSRRVAAWRAARTRWSTSPTVSPETPAISPPARAAGWSSNSSACRWPRGPSSPTSASARTTSSSPLFRIRTVSSRSAAARRAKASSCGCAAIPWSSGASSTSAEVPEPAEVLAYLLRRAAWAAILCLTACVRAGHHPRRAARHACADRRRPLAEPGRELLLEVTARPCSDHRLLRGAVLEEDHRGQREHPVVRRVQRMVVDVDHHEGDAVAVLGLELLEGLADRLARPAPGCPQLAHHRAP